MSSKITTIYDQILVELAALFTGHTRIPYAYDLGNNDDNFLRKGYGLKVGSSTKVDLALCDIAFDRTFTVVVTRESFNTGSNPTGYDDLVKELMEDLFLVQERFMAQDQLSIEASIVKIEPAGQSPIEQLEGDRVNFLTQEADFIFTIKEDY